jgi:hypothetical protein
MTTAKRFSVRELIPQQRIRTTDTARSTGDAILSAIALGSREEREFTSRTGPILGLNLGLRWVGDLQPVGAAVAQVVDALRRVDKARQKDALTKALVALAKGFAADEATAGPSDSTTFNGNLGTNITPEDINKANDRFWADRLGRPCATDSTGPGLSTRATPDSINAANALFWANQPTHVGHQWGKG